MPSPSLLHGFAWRLVLVYGLLIVPWPGFDEAYGRYFRALGGLAFARESGSRVLRFEPVPAGPRHRLDTRIMLADRERLDRTGSGPVWYLELDARGVGWVPTALTLALVLATPINRRRRGWALLWGGLAVHGLILFSMAACIGAGWMELPGPACGPFWKHTIEGLEETLIVQMGAGFFGPVLIWVLVALRRKDLVRWRDGTDPWAHNAAILPRNVSDTCATH